MAKLLDLDALYPAKKQIMLGGKKYDLQPLTVKLFTLAQSYQHGGIESQNPSEQIEAGMELVNELIPELSREDIQAMPIEFLQEIVSFAFIQGEEINEEHAGEEAK
ncbi:MULTISPECIES: hypothetical protein [Providencia]|uniref:hypothetical protein n=1 Tax=Providencia TaxID=586 RepID=UPI0023492157|nr:hypothetical protein [Providencia sp. PROV089]